MKMRKLQAALKKAQAVQRAARAGYQKASERAVVAGQSLARTKALYKAMRKELKGLRREAATNFRALKAAKADLKANTALVEKLDRKLKKAGRKGAVTKKPKLARKAAPRAVRKIRPAISVSREAPAALAAV